ncbi:MAG: GDP-mannose 4,6-dehydratase [Vicinamibacterales bacterium]|nr:GDP-mannose 4,6-dehydratase [Vicinamibacterales bacterium]
MPVHVLVTGASGFVGSHLLPLVAAEGDVAIHAWTRDVVPDWPARWTVIDMGDRRAVERAIAGAPPDVVYHLAGAAHVGQSFASVADTLETNAFGTAVLLDALRAHAPHARILVVSSSTVYRASAGPLDEGSPVGPTSPYGLSKLAAERLAVRAHEQDGLHTVVARAFNHVGPRQSPAFFASSFASQIAEIERGARVSTLRVGNLDARRDLTDVRDVVRAYQALVRLGAPGGIYNVCSGRAHGIGEMLQAMIASARVPVAVEVDPALLRPNDTPLVLGSYARLAEATGWAPTFPIERTMADVLADWRQRPRPAAPTG